MYHRVLSSSSFSDVTIIVFYLSPSVMVMLWLILKKTRSRWIWPLCLSLSHHDGGVDWNCRIKAIGTHYHGSSNTYPTYHLCWHCHRGRRYRHENHWHSWTNVCIFRNEADDILLTQGSLSIYEYYCIIYSTQFKCKIKKCIIIAHQPLYHRPNVLCKLIRNYCIIYSTQFKCKQKNV